MKALKSTTGPLAILALALVPSIAVAEVVPPDNSAATQYTETYPTAGGPAKTGTHERRRSPSQVLGPRKTKRLATQGPQGKAAAALAAATAPAATTQEMPTAVKPNGASRQRHAAGLEHDGPRTSGIGEVIARATGTSSSGGLGALLPLLLAGVVAWSLLYAVRQRRKSVA